MLISRLEAGLCKFESHTYLYLWLGFCFLTVDFFFLPTVLRRMESFISWVSFTSLLCSGQPWALREDVSSSLPPQGVQDKYPAPVF